MSLLFQLMMTANQGLLAEELIENNFAAPSIVAQGGGLNGEGVPIFNMYAGMDFLENRIQIMYRVCTNHDAFDGVIWGKHSEDDGETFQGEQQYYDPAHIFTDFPDILQQDPDYLLDARDTRLMLSPDGTHLLMFCFVAAGKNNVGTGPGTGVAGNGRNYPTLPVKTWYSMCVRFPIINTNQLDFNNKDIVYISTDNRVFSGGFIELPNGDILVGLYEPVGGQPGIHLYNSSDNGASWSYVTWVFRTGDAGVGVSAISEIAFALDGNTLFAVGRTETTNIVAKSDDFGLNWTYGPSPMPHSSVGQSLIVLPGGKLAIFGRYFPSIYEFDATTLEYIPNSEFDWLNSGYGSLLKYKDKYCSSYYRNDTIEFMQLRYNETKPKFEFNVQGTPVNTVDLRNLIFNSVNGTDLTLQLGMFSFDDLTEKTNLTWRIYDNGVLFHELGSSELDTNVVLATVNPELTFPIQLDTNYLFTVTCVDDDGAESAPSNNNLPYFLSS